MTLRWFSVVSVHLLLVPVLLGADVEENYPDGTLKVKYAVNGDGQKHGAFTEYHPSGKVKVKARYAANELDGSYTSFHENGKAHVTAMYQKGKLSGAYKEQTEKGQTQLTASYKDNKLDGWRADYENGKPVVSQFYKSGEMLLPRSLEQIQRQLAELQRVPPSKITDPLILEREAALRHLKCYRYLCDVPYDNLELDDEMNKCAQAGARLCEKIGKLDHKPANPGLPEEEYKIGYEGTSHSNLHMGSKLLTESLDGYMDDSDESNRDRVGHRRWCLNPALKKTGFGKSGKFFAMWSMDKSQDKVPDYDFVSFPPRGLMPTTYFKPEYVWSISLNPKKYQVPGPDVKVKVYGADKEYKRVSQPLPLKYSHIDTGGMGIPNCIIFQPQLDKGSTGLPRYWVELEGVKDSKGEPATVRFLTEFVVLR